MLDRLAALDTCAVSDALDFLGLSGATIGIRPLWDCDKIVGRAMTVLVGDKTDAAPTVHMITPAIEAADDETILVIANEGDKNVSCWGDIVANAASAKSVRGVAIDGCCRDIGANEDLGFPVFGRGVVPVTARNRLVQKSFGEPIKFGGVPVATGDYVIADRCGVVTVPESRIEAILDIAERLMKREEAMIAGIKQGRSVVEMMHDTQFQAVMEPTQTP